MESQGQIAVSNVCRAVVRAVEKLDEEWSPATLDVMIFHSNQLYRLLLAYCGDTHVLEEVGRSLTLLSEIEESMEETGPTGYVAQLEPRTNGRGRPFGKSLLIVTYLPKGLEVIFGGSYKEKSHRINACTYTLYLWYYSSVGRK